MNAVDAVDAVDAAFKAAFKKVPPGNHWAWPSLDRGEWSPKSLLILYHERGLSDEWSEPTMEAAWRRLEKELEKRVFGFPVFVESINPAVSCEGLPVRRRDTGAVCGAGTSTTVRIESDGTRVFQHRGKICREAPSAEPPRPTGYYWPFCGRRAFLAGRKDHRATDMFAEIIRDRRQRVGYFRAVKPGPQ